MANDLYRATVKPANPGRTDAEVSLQEMIDDGVLVSVTISIEDCSDPWECCIHHPPKGDLWSRTERQAEAAENRRGWAEAFRNGE